MSGLEQRDRPGAGRRVAGPAAADRRRPARARARATAGTQHRAVDVVAVVLSGSLHHRWDGDVPLAAGDVAVLRAGSGLDHDEVAGDDGARVLQCYLRSADPGRRAGPRGAPRGVRAGWTWTGPTPGCGWRRVTRRATPCRRDCSSCAARTAWSWSEQPGRRGGRGRGWRWSGSWTPPARPGPPTGQDPLPPRTRSSRRDPAGGRRVREWGACRPAPPICSPPPTTTPTAPIDLRRRLHRHPEIGLHLPRTQATGARGLRRPAGRGDHRDSRPARWSASCAVPGPARPTCCAATWTPCPCTRTPGCRSPPRCPAPCTPAGTTPTWRCCSAPPGCWPSAATSWPARSCSWSSRGRRASTAPASCSRRACSTSSRRRR